MPASCTSSAIRSSTSRAVAASSSPVGSSAIRSSGRGDRGREGDPLLLAAGQLARVRITARSQADAFEQLVRAGLPPRRRLTGEAELDADELARGQLAGEGAPVVLVGVAERARAEASRRPGAERRDVDVRHADRAGRGPVETGHDPEQRRLARAARAEDDAELAAVDRERETLEGGDAALPRGVDAEEILDVDEPAHSTASTRPGAGAVNARRVASRTSAVAAAT